MKRLKTKYGDEWKFVLTVRLMLSAGFLCFAAITYWYWR